jgi:hypothetical protein
LDDVAFRQLAVGEMLVNSAGAVGPAHQFRKCGILQFSKKYQAILNKKWCNSWKVPCFLKARIFRMGEALNHFLHAMSDELAGRCASRINGHD